MTHDVIRSAGETSIQMRMMSLDNVYPIMSPENWTVERGLQGAKQQ